MQYEEIAREILALKEADLAFRDQLIESGQLNEGYHPEMEAIHLRNAERLEELMEQIGYPTVEKVGTEGSEAAWLIIQHSISKPTFMKKSRALLEAAINNGRANPIHLAYLTDRIAIFEDRPQLYGTGFDWDQQGALSPQPYDDLAKVETRRKAVGLRSLAEQIKLMRTQAKDNQEQPPADQEKKQIAYEAWRKKVGWKK